jgi:hypothetical protein
LPRRHSISAAGALAAAVVLTLIGPANAQDYGAPPLRGRLEPEAEVTGEDPQKAKEQAIPTQDSVTPAEAGGEPAAETDTAPSNQAGPLGGLGDTGAEPVPEVRPEPTTGALEEGKQAEEIEAEVEATFPLPPGIDLTSRELGYLHSATLPEPHDLDPYLPIGFRLGTFLFFPEVETGGIFTDNVLNTRTDTKSDKAIEVAPTLRLVSDWSRHFFAAEFSADRSWYEDFPVEDDKIYQALLKGRIDVTSRDHLGLEAEKSQTQAGANSVSITDIAGDVTNLQEEHLTGYADHRFNRLTLTLTGTVADYKYDDANDVSLSGPIPFGDIRDYRETLEVLRTSYEFNSNWAGFVEGALDQRDYKEDVNIGGFRRSSMGERAATGVTLTLARLTGEISIGWGKQDSIDDRLSPIEGALVNGDLIWMLSPLTKVEFIARSEIDETTLEDSLGAIDRFYELSIQHAFWTYLVLGTYVSYENADYVDNPLVDQRLKEGLTAEYYFNPITSVYARYEHTDFFSTDAASDFVENEVRVGMKIRR